MCGRFAQDFSREEAFKLAHELNIALKWDPAQDLLSDSNIAPQGEILLVRATANTLEVRKATFGIRLSSTAIVNARSETVREKPLFSRLLPKGCCFIPASGFFEWGTTPQGKVPTFFRDIDNRPLYLSAIFDAKSGGAVVLTMSATSPVSLIHNRQPVMATSDQLIGWCESGTLATSNIKLRGDQVDVKFNNPRYKTSP